MDIKNEKKLAIVKLLLDGKKLFTKGMVQGSYLYFDDKYLGTVETPFRCKLGKEDIPFTSFWENEFQEIT